MSTFLRVSSPRNCISKAFSDITIFRASASTVVTYVQSSWGHSTSFSSDFDSFSVPIGHRCCWSYKAYLYLFFSLLFFDSRVYFLRGYILGLANNITQKVRYWVLPRTLESPHTMTLHFMGSPHAMTPHFMGSPHAMTPHFLPLSCLQPRHLTVHHPGSLVNNKVIY
jgi:hypothetical protein